MKVLKGLTVSLLGFLLFLSLSIFGVAFTINYTLLNPDFVVTEVDKIDIASLAEEVLEKQLSQQLPEEVQFIKEAAHSVIADLEPLIKEELSDAIYTGYDYFLGKTERLSIVIPLDPLKEKLKDSLRQRITQLLPPQLSGLPPAQLDQYFDQYYQQFSEQIPSSFEVNEALLPQDVKAQIVQVRQGISYFQTIYNILIGFMVLLVLGIILISRDVKEITRKLGIILLSYGAIEYAGVFVAKYFLPASIPLPPEIPQALQEWLPGFFNDLLAPLGAFSLGIMGGGIVLIALSFVYRRQEAEA